MSLFLQETGEPNLPTILFLHGVGTSGWMWQHQISALAGFHCLNIDLPGHGKSNQVEWVSLADTAELIADLIRSHAAGGQAHVVGLSLGGHLALILLERHPDVLERVIISGVTAEPLPNRSLRIPQVLMMGVLKQPRFGRQQARSIGISPEMQDAFVENFAAMSLQAYNRILKEVADYQLPAALGQVDTPTLIVAGGRETDIIQQAVGTIAGLMPNAQGRIAPGVGHGWNVENPGLFNAMTRAWLTKAQLPPQLRPV